MFNSFTADECFQKYVDLSLDYLTYFTLENIQEDQMENALFAAGCFWGVEETFRKVPGVLSTEVGYTGGYTDRPTYKQVCTGSTGHAEAVMITFNPEIISFEKLLDIFWKIHNPTTLNAQGPDIGTQYRSAIFYFDEKQKSMAESSRNSFNLTSRYSSQAVTEITPFTKFFPAEEYHQKYLQKNPHRHCYE